MKYIYRQGSDIYDASSQKRLTPTEFGTGAGFKELTAINGAQYNTADLQKANFDNITQVGNTLYGLQKTAPVKPIINSSPSVPVIDSQTLNNGTNSPTIPLGSANTEAQKILNDNAIQSATDANNKYQAEADRIKLANLKQIETDKANAEKSITDLQTQKTSDIAGYDASMKPATDLARSEYTRMLGSLEQINYNDLVAKRLELTNDVINYGKLMNDELAQEASRPAIASVKQGRQANVKETYTSKIATSQAALQAIDGNFSLAFDIMNQGANAINQTTSDRINFLNSVSSIYGDKIESAEKKLTSLTTDEKNAIDQTIKDLEAKQKNVDENKAEIMKLMETNPIIAQKANLLLTDTPEQRATKLQDFYVKNPQYTPESQDFIKKAMEKYYDAGITMNDPIATVQSKIKNSATYQKENAGKYTYTPDGKVFNSTTGEISDGSVQIPQSSRLASVNNNPGNLRFVGQAGATQGEGGFARFSTPEAGYQALINQVQLDQSRGLSVYGFVSKYAPPTENNTALYVEQFNKALGSTTNTKISDLNTEEIAKFMAMKESGTKISQSGNNQSAENWAKLINEGRVKLNEVPQAERAAVVATLAKSGNISQVDATVTESINNKIALIDDIKKTMTKFGANAVGPSSLARMDIASWITGGKQELIGQVEQLVSQGTMDALLNLKKAGGTLGALSEGEKEMLKSSFSKLGTWAVKKDDKVVGYNISEKAFKTELDNIKNMAQKALKEAGGSTGVINSLEQTLASNPQLVNEYNTLVSDNPDLTDDEILQLLGVQ